MFKSMTRHPLYWFFILTFFIAWSIWLPVGWLAPKYFLLAVIPGAWAPTIASVILVGLANGRSGIRQFIGRVFRWRVGIQWYMITLFGIAVIAYIALGINVLLGGAMPGLNLPAGVPENPLPLILPMIFFINIFAGGPLAEDIGWRGYALPKLKEASNAFLASLIIGILWVMWHLPFFWIPEGRTAIGGIPLIWFTLMTIAWSVLFAWVYVNTESILMPVLFHASVNTTLGTLGILGQSSGDLSPLALNTMVTWITVALILLKYGMDLKRPAMVMP